MTCRSQTSQIRGSLSEVIPSQVAAIKPEGVETRRDEFIPCRRCKVSKAPSDYYHKDNKTGHKDSTCKKCRRIEMRENVLGVTDAQFWELYRRQQGRCGICGKRLRTDRYKAVATDHNHETGKIRGLLCSRCNLGLGHFEEDGLYHEAEDRLMRAIKWIKG